MPDNFIERTKLLIGVDGVKKLQEKKVLIAGVGGVGSYVAEALSRSGVGTIILIDHDRVSLSNINRQLVALHSTIGINKAALMRDRINDINPDCNAIALEVFLDSTNIEEILKKYQVDYVVDAIDSLSCKVALLETSYRLGYKTIASMGAGGKKDPTKIVVDDIHKTFACHLARHIRRELRDKKIGKGIKAVFSTEKHLPPGDTGEELFRGRARRPNGTMSYMPSLFGMTIAGVVVLDLLETKKN